AATEFEKVVAADPANARARLGLAQARFWSGRPADARKALEPVVATTDNAEIKALWNEVLTASGNARDALQVAEERLRENPDDPQLQRAQANLLVSLGCYGPAIQALRAIHEANPNEAAIALELAHAYFTADRYPEAIEICRRFTEEAAPAGIQARILLARCLLKARRITDAVTVLEQILQDNPGEPRAALGLLTVAVLTPDDAPDVQRLVTVLMTTEARERLETDDRVREWLFALVGELVSRPATEPYRALARGLLQPLAPDAAAAPASRLCRQALAQYAEDGPEAVDPEIEVLVQAIADDTVEQRELLEACNVLLTLYAGPKLVSVCDAALAKDPANTLIALYRAEGLAVTAEYKQAQQAYERVLAELPQCTKARRGLARAYSWHRAFDKAEETYNALIEQHPDDMILRREAARSLSWDKKLKDSLDAYDDAIEAMGESPAERIWADRLEIERKAKRAHLWIRDCEAVEHYTTLLEDQPADLEGRFDLAQVYARNRLWEEAAEQYAEILNIDARHRRARDALYKNGLYHRPELTTAFEWLREDGRGDLVDINTRRLTSTIKQEVARRTDLSLTHTQRWHSFERFGGGRLDERELVARVDHRFDLQTYGHIASGVAALPETEEHHHYVADFGLTHEPTDWLAATVGFQRMPWRRNRMTLMQGLDQNRLYVRLFSNVDPWLDLWVEYGHSWIDDGRLRISRKETWRTKQNAMDELNWGAAYRFSLFPKILQVEYRGFAWWFDERVPTYYSPAGFVVNTWRLAWRHYLNTDQYVEQKQLYYEVGVNGGVDSNGIFGGGYNAEVGWDLCHHFGVQAKWDSYCSSVYDANIFYIQLTARF
ncbi:MAG: tetratricopeptide repeat protein, partial [Phycisphaerae bacterium]|nr:tetratricopeptide repeat protein [Phycisphaerae bacterium]